ncbi:hypothetical protein FCR2A7T_22330 [Flavobacterium cauense R2A-7]|uniref:Putative membrane protein n=1 Tax=Flavobacterium cauense R2A-7 TaxID=1341154 RepID=V6S366_9FLAO|nr:hypothetical protein [Flavobacterium cauense]ESU18830.1 hypothetical protein FCR2A7T_22330 [Flavobacterium cauense R2A-7]KGO81703.1 hypothetical protein Q762_07600 [Flavobacterium cauense R2A-7]TWI13731.1 putative membrane protein [Flavobacterium cauense R2A-7]
MNDAHLHMVVNHFPIIGTILGLGILIAGLLLKNKSVQHTAYVLFTIAAIFGLLSMNTGEGAEEMVEDLPNVGKQIIHEHEEIAEKFVILLYLTGAVALLSLFMSFKNHAKAKFFAYATLILAIGTAVLSKNVGTSGGEIRHTEIRENASNNEASSQTNGTETTDDEH